MKKVSICILTIFLVFSLIGQSTASASTRFKDVGDNYWAKKEIDYLVNKKVINGYSNGTFKPNDNVTNAQVAIMLARALNLDLSNRPNPNFTDVTSKTSGYKEIAACVDEGIFPKSIKFGPTQPASRVTMARVLVNAFKLKGVNHSLFTDVPTSYWGYPYISALAANNITNGYVDGSFKPNNNVTRAQFSVFVARALNENFRPKPSVTRGVRFNMTVSQVESTETAKLSYRMKDGDMSALVYDIKKYGYNSELIYFFEKGRLVYIAIDFLPDTLRYDDEKTMFSLHNKLTNAASKELGTDYYSGYDYDYDYLNIYSEWFKSFYTAMLIVDDAYGYTSAVLVYTPETVKISNETTTNSAKDLIDPTIFEMIAKNK